MQFSIDIKLNITLILLVIVIILLLINHFRKSSSEQFAPLPPIVCEKCAKIMQYNYDRIRPYLPIPLRDKTDFQGVTTANLSDYITNNPKSGIRQICTQLGATCVENPLPPAIGYEFSNWSDCTGFTSSLDPKQAACLQTRTCSSSDGKPIDSYKCPDAVVKVCPSMKYDAASNKCLA